MTGSRGPAATRVPLMKQLLSIVGIVTAVALFGMLLGAAFGWAAGSVAPFFFKMLVPSNDADPVGTAVVLGAFGGVVCGGGLGAFALVLSVFATSRRRPREP